MLAQLLTKTIKKGSAGCPKSATPSVVQCKQVGWDGFDAQWECSADLGSEYKFGEVTVVCEGYEYPEDQYILGGSCGLEYTLEYTSQSNNNNNNYNYGSHYNHYGLYSHYFYKSLLKHCFFR